MQSRLQFLPSSLSLFFFLMNFIKNKLSFNVFISEKSRRSLVKAEFMWD